ncbi:MAG: hypothetical protein IPK19_24320 [Chloroflexi bacterium]|nr:hypothetical protein [Chloroflexota bacterium]
MRLHRIVRQVGVLGTALALLVGGGVFAQENSFGVTFPPLTGDFPVGMTIRNYTDESRLEIYTEDASDSRTIPVTFYYPAAPAADEASGVYATPAEVEAFTSALGLPPFVSDAFHPNFIRDAAGQPPRAAIPSCCSCPAWARRRASTSHCWSRSRARLCRRRCRSGLQHGAVAVSRWLLCVEAVPQGLDVSTPELRDALGASWVNDARFILDTLTAVNADDPLLAGLFDLTRFGMFGHSFGGAAAFQMAHDDDRVLAAINMDGSPFGTVIAEGVGKPILYMLSEEAIAASTTITDEALEAAGITEKRLTPCWPSSSRTAPACWSLRRAPTSSCWPGRSIIRIPPIQAWHAVCCRCWCPRRWSARSNRTAP